MCNRTVFHENCKLPGSFGKAAVPFLLYTTQLYAFSLAKWEPAATARSENLQRRPEQQKTTAQALLVE